MERISLKDKIMKVAYAQPDGFIVPNQSDFSDDEIHEVFWAIDSLIEDGIFRRRNCEGLAYEFEPAYLRELQKNEIKVNNEIYNLDDEYVLHMCDKCYKPYEIYKPKHWTDATYYINAWSDDGVDWLLMDVCGQNIGTITETSLKGVVTKLKNLNINRHYRAQPSMNCAGFSSKASDFRSLPHVDSISELFELYKSYPTYIPPKSSLEGQIKRAEIVKTSPQTLDKIVSEKTI